MAEEKERKGAPHSEVPAGPDAKKDKTRKWLIIGAVAAVLLVYLQYRASQNASAGSATIPSAVPVPTSGGYSGPASAPSGGGGGGGYGAANAASLASISSELQALQASVTGTSASSTPVTSPTSTTGINPGGVMIPGPIPATGLSNIPPVSTTGPTLHLQTPTGYTGAANIQQAIAAHRSGLTVFARNNQTGVLSVFNPGSGTTPKGATLFVPTKTHG